MITTNESLKINNQAKLSGLSTDVKPLYYPEAPNVPIPNGSTFIEMDTGSLYMLDAENAQWYKIVSSSGGEVVPPTNNKLYLYKDGDECVDITGGWDISHTTRGVFTKESDGILLNVADTTWAQSYELAFPKNNVDRTEYKTLHLEFEVVHAPILAGKYYDYCFLVTNPTLYSKYGQTTETIQDDGEGHISDPAGSTMHYTTNLSAVAKDSIIQVVCIYETQPSRISYKIKKVWLEK